ncbi:MAG: hypothetical protein QG670_2359 [Thermoproteota archaeon]|nr:hypothetical protein [Thermoproteota archaeon]
MSEVITGVLPHVLQSTGGLGSRHFTIILTNKYLIIAELTSQMMSEALAKSKANKQGKGFLGELLTGRVLTAKDLVDYTNKYWLMTPEKIISESPGNFSLEISSISAVKVEYTRKKSLSDDSTISFYTFIIESDYGMYSYIFDADPQDMDALARVLGNKLTGSGRSSPVRPLSTRREAKPYQSGNRFCIHCGQQLPVDSRFCPACGKEVK